MAKVTFFYEFTDIMGKVLAICAVKSEQVTGE